jgi:hypothetical protein
MVVHKSLFYSRELGEYRWPKIMSLGVWNGWQGGITLSSHTLNQRQ